MRHTAETIDQVLAEYARTQSYKITARETGVDYRTVQAWVTDKYPDRYAEILNAWHAGQDKRHVAMFNANIEKANDTTSRALEHADKLLTRKDWRNFNYVTAGTADDITHQPQIANP